MIFLFFGTSLAHLEAKLSPFKYWEEIGNIPVTRVSNGQGGWAATVGRFDTLYSVHRILKHVGDPINVKAF